MFFIFKPKDFIEIKDSSKAKNKKKSAKNPNKHPLILAILSNFSVIACKYASFNRVS